MQSSSPVVATNRLTPSFLQLRCPSCRAINNVGALKGKRVEMTAAVKYTTGKWEVDRYTLDSVIGNMTVLSLGRRFQLNSNARLATSSTNSGRRCYAMHVEK